MTQTSNSREDRTSDSGDDSSSETGERIAKVLARAGIASRREVERMIEAGRIRVHGQVLKTAAVTVTRLDGISVDGQPVSAPEETRLWRLHKRRGTLTTATDPEGRKTVFDALPAHLGRVITVGRLDMNTEGLLLLTNDGGLARWLELPTTGLPRTYRVRVYGTLDAAKIANMRDGATIDGVHYGPVLIEAEEQKSANTWLTVTIFEGKNREVRRLMAHLGLEVTRLIRTHYGPFALGNLPLDHVARVPGDHLLKACADYFDEAAVQGGVTAPKLTAERKGWAKAKLKDKPKPRRKAKIAARKAADGDAQDTRRSNTRNNTRGNTRAGDSRAHKGRGKSTGKMQGAHAGKPDGKPGEKPAGGQSGKPGARRSQGAAEPPRSTNARPNHGGDRRPRSPKARG